MNLRVTLPLIYFLWFWNWEVVQTYRYVLLCLSATQMAVFLYLTLFFRHIPYLHPPFHLTGLSPIPFRALLEKCILNKEKYKLRSRL
jgi:hypothetical protein